ncbi:DNA alkylation repair protein [Paenibacillus thermotolerans]|uniref:DNA alkylation repair protein n=1 Tax=Paenibacillus thermotolerans TaxID=3027807 RepID=UPI0023679B1F|nr:MULTISPECIES: DNA alkylation repair protein [unclassified Paenibacillus]
MCNGTLYAVRLRERFLLERNEADAAAMSKYMRDQFVFIGIRAPQVQAICKEFIRTNGLPAREELHETIEALWHYDERELQMAALIVLERMKSGFAVNDIGLLEQIVVHKSWWDTIDHIAKHLIGHYFLLYPGMRDPKVEEWLASGNLWLIRCAILFQLGYKERTDEALLESVISRTCGTKEFFINKAIGWALREYGKVRPEFVERIVETYALAPLSRREALKLLRK